MKKNNRTDDHLFSSRSASLAGTLFFTFRFFTKGGQWVSFPSNRHLYTDGVLSRGRILDTEGSVLAAYDGGWQFHDSGSVRKATLRGRRPRRGDRHGSTDAVRF